MQNVVVLIKLSNILSVVMGLSTSTKVVNPY